ncbi:hypothetical protein SAY86_027430 [Trapa natans]|uniref:Uncharacterized protein n=1 Tax=Trapa natans TaxID=22666 RepID=A0AAN7QM70_TRANT|nr:hypothetical protein SAY86_027430 [Trapa natans]
MVNESSFRYGIQRVGNGFEQLQLHASDNVNKILVGNKADMDESKRAVPTAKGQALADEYGIKFFETSAKINLNVEQVFFSIAKDIKQRLADTDSKFEVLISYVPSMLQCPLDVDVRLLMSFWVSPVYSSYPISSLDFPNSTIEFLAPFSLIGLLGFSPSLLPLLFLCYGAIMPADP